MSQTTKVIKFLQNYNAWRRGDETLEMPHPVEIGANIQDAIALLRKNAELEAELATERARLDAVISNSWLVYHCSDSSFAVFSNICADYVSPWLATKRTAIDAAMKAEANASTYLQRANSFRKLSDEAEAECLEQARLLGKGAEREADLIGKVERLERALLTNGSENSEIKFFDKL